MTVGKLLHVVVFCQTLTSQYTVIHNFIFHTFTVFSLLSAGFHPVVIWVTYYVSYHCVIMALIKTL